MLEKNMKDIIVFSVLLLLTYTVMQGVDLIQTSLFVRVRNKLWGKLYDKVYQKLSRLPLTYYFEKDSAEIIGTIESDINSVSSVADEMTAFFSSSNPADCRGNGGTVYAELEACVFGCVFDSG